MTKDIAFCGNFSLRYKRDSCTTHDIVIVKWHKGHNVKYCYAIAYWNDDKEPSLVSCGTHLIGDIESMEDLEAVKKLTKIGELILQTDPEPIKLD